MHLGSAVALHRFRGITETTALPISDNSGTRPTMNRLQLGLLLICVLLLGCVKFKPVVDQTRHFVLNPVHTTTPVADPSGGRLVFGMSPVEIPDYLDCLELAERTSDTEVHYQTRLRWAERLKKGIQRVLVANLDSQLGSTNATMLAWRRNDVHAVVTVSIQRFEHQASGQASLEARWRITEPTGGAVLRNGSYSASKPSARLDVDPGAAVSVLGDLLGDLARQLSRDLAETKPSNSPPHPSIPGSSQR
jgi:uncharacterized lipoprotein YmbA